MIALVSVPSGCAVNIHIQGICGTFMAGVAVLAKALGHHVTGVEGAMYPPMCDQLDAAGIQTEIGYDSPLPEGHIDQVIVGNALSRGMPQVEAVLNGPWPLYSGISWLASHVLDSRRVLAVSGTHGKTSTASLLVWILKQAGGDPGYLIGGLPRFSKVSAELGSDPWFVLEADEYDSAFFDKRAKFLSVQPYGLILNNLEFDHADIYDNVEQIQAAFLQWVRVLPRDGMLVCPTQPKHLEPIVQQASQWTQIQALDTAAQLHLKDVPSDPFSMALWDADTLQGVFSGSWVCPHLARNALAAACLAHYCVGIPIARVLKALNTFPGIARRMECVGQLKHSFLYDDFAHHPTAISATVRALRARHPGLRLWVCLELGAYSLRQADQAHDLVTALAEADGVFLMRPDPDKSSLNISDCVMKLSGRLVPFSQPGALLAVAKALLAQGDVVVVTLSSRDFEGVRAPLFSWWRKACSGAMHVM